MNKRILFLFLFITVVSGLFAQEGPVSYDIQLQGGYCGPNEVPFWFRSNQFGSVPPSGASLGLISAVRKDYNPAKTRKTDWGFSVEGRLNVGNPTDFILTEGYGKLRLSIFELKAGRVREITGLCDTILSSGSWSVSGNALGVPKIQVAIPEFYTLPVLGKLFAFKGSYMHGWIGNWYMNDEAVPNTPTYLHQKTLYGRFGKPSWRLKLFAGFNHQVVWGNERNIFLGEYYELNDWQTFLYVNTGKRYNNEKIQETRIGNHMGSIDFALSYEFEALHIFLYRQSFYETGTLLYLSNILDGLNGISLINLATAGKKILWKSILFEFLYTKNQGMEKWSKPTPSRSSYYNNGYYPIGWSYKGLGLGNPLISPENSVRNGLPAAPNEFFINNRVAALHIGMTGIIMNWHFLSLFSYSQNFGTYRTSTTGRPSSGLIFPSPYGVFPKLEQLLIYLQVEKELNKGIEIGFSAALDKGKLFNNTFGIFCSLAKSF